MLRILISIFLTSCFIQGYSQGRVSYITLDSLSNVVSMLQAEAEELTYTEDNRQITVSFIPENFTITSFDRKAAHVVYKSAGSDEWMEVTENVDLSKAIGLTYQYANAPQAVRVRVHFPAGSVHTAIYEDNKWKKNVRRDYLDFYVNNHNQQGKPRNAPYSTSQMFHTLAVIYFYLRIEKEEMTVRERARLLDDYRAANDEEGWTLFLTKHPSSIYSMFFRDLLKRAEESRVRAAESRVRMKEAVARFIDSLCVLYRYRPGLTEEEFISYNQEAGEVKVKMKVEDHVLYRRRGDRERWPLGSGVFMLSEQGKLYNYEHRIFHIKKDRAAADQFFLNWVEAARERVPQSYLMLNDSKTHLKIDHPEVKTFMEARVTHMNNYSYVTLEFTTYDFR